MVAVLTENKYQTARKYWNVLKHRLVQEGNESVTNCNQLKLKSSDGKYYKTDVADTELAIDRALQTYLKKGYSKDWINQRLKSIEIRKQLTDEWERVGIVKQKDFAILTN